MELKLAPGVTAKELSGRLGLSLNAIRHHLKELEVDGLLEHEREQRGVGAPVFAYRLSASGERVFPRRYESALTDVLETLVEREGREAVVGALEARYADSSGGCRPTWRSFRPSAGWPSSPGC